jgi:endonuclease YncB( thermonuclease family)
VPRALRTAALQLRTAQRIVRLRGFSVRRGLEPPDARLVFVVGSPRSGTTFLAGAIGSLPGFVDLGEVAPLKAAIPELYAEPSELAARRIRGILTVTRRLSLVGGRRAVEQTPETAFVSRAAALAFPEARFVHIVRDGRDVACSLLERGWLRAGRGGGDDAGLPYGAGARFWVEPERREEFRAASDARRAAWAWRRYVSAARAAPAERLHELRYEALTADPAGTARVLAGFLDAPVNELSQELRAARDTSVGRWSKELSPADLAEVEEECGALLRDLGYLQSC